MRLRFHKPVHPISVCKRSCLVCMPCVVIFVRCAPRLQWQTGSQTDVAVYVPRTVNGERLQVWHLPEAGANVPRSLADGRMDVEGAPGAAAGVDWRLLLLLLQVGLAVPYRATFYRSRRPASLPDDANVLYRHGLRYTSVGVRDIVVVVVQLSGRSRIFLASGKTATALRPTV